MTTCFMCLLHYFICLGLYYMYLVRVKDHRMNIKFIISFHRFNMFFWILLLCLLWSYAEGVHICDQCSKGCLTTSDGTFIGCETRYFRCIDASRLTNINCLWMGEQQFKGIIYYNIVIGKSHRLTVKTNNR
jgi:hypothetical protein